MSTLQGFPMLSQLADTNEPNAQFDCVPTCIAASLQWLTGKPFDGGAIKDIVYGKDYTGGTDAKEYAPYCASQGVHLYEVSDQAAKLIALVHGYLAQQVPVILTILDPYVPESRGWTHAIVAYADGPGEITVLDPYIGKGVTKSDAEWAGLLRSSSLWILEKLQMNTVPQGWHDDGTTLIAPNGHKVVRGFRDYVLANGWHPDNVPLQDEIGLAQLEDSNPSLGGGTQQIFRWTVLEWTQTKGVFVMWVGVELSYIRNKAAQYYNAVKSLTAQLQGLQPDPKIAALEAQVAALQQALEAEKAKEQQAVILLQKN